MSAIRDAVMGDNNYYYKARARDVDLESITSSDNNALILERLRNNDDSFEQMGIAGDFLNWTDDDDFVVDVQEGDNVGWLGYFIGTSTRLETLWIHHLPGDDSFRQGFAQNQSIQQVNVCSDLGEAGFQSLAAFLRSTSTLEELHFSISMPSPECVHNIALLLGRHIKSLKRLVLFEENDLNDEGFVEIALALVAQPQLEKLDLTPWSMVDNPCGRRGYATLGTTMAKWRSPSLKNLVIYANDFDDDGFLALLVGMANCVNLEHLDLRANDLITEVGLKALSSLFQSKTFRLKSLDLSSMGIGNEGMITLASGLAALHSLKTFRFFENAIGDEGLQSLAAGLSNNKNLEILSLSDNGPFSEVGLMRLSDMIPTASNLKELYLCNNAINDEGLQALAVGLRQHPTLVKLSLSSNAIGSEGLRALAATDMSSLRWLSLANNTINDEALGVLVEGMEKFSLETLDLSGNNLVTSTGLAVFAPIFQRVSCPLKEIDVSRTNIEDSEAKAFAEGLVGNESLTRLLFDYTNVTAVGWSAFSTLLCDTSSVNNVYLSNHTLKEIGSRYYRPDFRDRFHSSVQRCLELNRQNEYDVTICKILMSHSDLDMTPFLRWKLKLLPFVLTWFERARSCRAYLEESITSFERRVLSAIYQFIHGLPLVVASGFNKQTSTGEGSKKRKFDLCDK